MHVNLFSEGLNLLCLGMGFVFIFLVFLVFAVKAMSKVLSRWFPETPAAQIAPKPVSKAPTNNNQLLAVIAAALHHKKIQQSSL